MRLVYIFFFFQHIVWFSRIFDKPNIFDPAYENRIKNKTRTISNGYE